MLTVPANLAFAVPAVSAVSGKKLSRAARSASTCSGTFAVARARDAFTASARNGCTVLSFSSHSRSEFCTFGNTSNRTRSVSITSHSPNASSDARWWCFALTHTSIAVVTNLVTNSTRNPGFPQNHASVPPSIGGNVSDANAVFNNGNAERGGSSFCRFLVAKSEVLNVARTRGPRLWPPETTAMPGVRRSGGAVVFFVPGKESVALTDEADAFFSSSTKYPAKFSSRVGSFANAES